MQLQTLTDLTQQSLADQIENFRLILFAPPMRNRNALMAWFINTGLEAYFYSLTERDSSLNALLPSLVEIFRDIDSQFGRQLNPALANSDANPADLADALLADLAKAKPKPRYLILDNLDHLVQNADTDQFFEQLVSGLPRGLQVVVNSRLMPYSPWSEFVRSGQAIVLGTQHVIDGGIFDPSVPEQPHLEVYSFEGGRVFVNGMPRDVWDGPLPRNLFYYFVDHPMVTRDDIFATFWPELTTKEATNVFHVTKRKISERLGYELTAYSGGFYRPSGQMVVHYDVANFERAVQQGREAQAPASPETWYQAIRLYRSQFLHGFDMPWIAQRREQLRLTYTEALIGVGRLHKSLGDTERAISYYLRALREVPHREDIHRDVMTLYEARGERDKALAQYELLAAMLKRTLNITPSKATRTLYNMLRGEGES